MAKNMIKDYLKKLLSSINPFKSTGEFLKPLGATTAETLISFMWC